MRIAVISDIHSNYFALQVVIKEIELAKAEKLFILGDTFGYYPWAIECYNLLADSPILKVFIKGNHDELIVRRNSNINCFVHPDYEIAIVQNLTELKKRGLLVWLMGLPSSTVLKLNGKNYSLCHGTPDDSLNGRFYPDDKNRYPWFPKNENDILLLGHTHYPFSKKISGGGIILNPGSVGQPRDGNVMPSWLLIDNNDYFFKRTPYDIDQTVSLLKKMDWSERAIKALQKNYKGKI